MKPLGVGGDCDGIFVPSASDYFGHREVGPLYCRAIKSSRLNLLGEWMFLRILPPHSRVDKESALESNCHLKPFKPHLECICSKF